MHLSPVVAIVLRQFYLLRGSFARIVPLFAWGAVDVLLWGFITKYLNTITNPGFNFVSVLLGAVLLWDFFGRVMHGVTTAFLEDVWARNFLNYFASPLSIIEYLTGLIFASIITSIFGLTVMLVLATAAFGLSIVAYGFAIIPFMLVLFLFGIAFGIFASAVVLRWGPASEWFVWPIPAILSPFVGVFYPIKTLPVWMQIIAKFLPPPYVFEGLRSIISDGKFSSVGLAVSAVLAVLYVMLAFWFFTLVYRYAVHTGLIARYSAESVS
jgi:ABC-2 type transport system permease protein